MKGVAVFFMGFILLLNFKSRAQNSIVNLGTFNSPVNLALPNSFNNKIISCSTNEIKNLKGLGCNNCEELLKIYKQNEIYSLKATDNKISISKYSETNKINLDGIVIPKELALSIFKCDCEGSNLYIGPGISCKSICTDTTLQAGNGAGTRSAIPSTRNKPGLRHETAPTPGKEDAVSSASQTGGQSKGAGGSDVTAKKSAEVKTLGDLVSYRTTNGTDTTNPTDTTVQAANGAGTRSAIPSTRNKPGLRHETGPAPGKETSVSSASRTGGQSKDSGGSDVTAKKSAEVNTLGDLVSYRTTNGTDTTNPTDTTVQAANGAGTRSAIPSTRNKPGLRHETAPTPGKEDAVSSASQTGGQSKGSGGSDVNAKKSAEVKTLGDLVSYRTTNGTDTTNPTDTTVQAANGAGTRSAIPSTRNKPGLRHETAPTPGKEDAVSSASQTGGQSKGAGGSDVNAKKSAEVKTLGDLVSYRTTNGTDTTNPTDTIVQAANGAGTRSAIPSTRNKPGLRHETGPAPGKENTLGNQQQQDNLIDNNLEPKYETSNFGELSANQRTADFEASYNALINASKKSVLIPNYVVKQGDLGFYSPSGLPKLIQGKDTFYISSKKSVSELVQTGVVYYHLQVLSSAGSAVNEMCFPVKVSASDLIKPTAALLEIGKQLQNSVLGSDELSGKLVQTRMYISETAKPYSIIMPYLTDQAVLFMMSTESGIVLSFTQKMIESSLQKRLLEGFNNYSK